MSLHDHPITVEMLLGTGPPAPARRVAAPPGLLAAAGAL